MLIMLLLLLLLLSLIVLHVGLERGQMGLKLLELAVGPSAAVVEFGVQCQINFQIWCKQMEATREPTGSCQLSSVSLYHHLPPPPPPSYTVPLEGSDRKWKARSG